ncbi:MAG: O-methyltransferase [Phycisphaerae bacterium]
MARRATELTEQLEDYVRPFSYRDDPALARIRSNTDAMAEAGMQVSPELGELLGIFVRLTGGRRVLEVGSFTGYSGACMARALSPGGRLVCFEKSEAYLKIAREHWELAGVAERIETRVGEALTTLAAAAAAEPGTYDLAFIDADKENAEAYVALSLTLLRPGGLVLVDNAFRSGQLADEANQSPGCVAMRNLLASLNVDERVDFTVLMLGDGVMMARKR